MEADEWMAVSFEVVPSVCFCHEVQDMTVRLFALGFLYNFFSANKINKVSEEETSRSASNCKALRFVEIEASHSFEVLPSYYCKVEKNQGDKCLAEK